MVKLRIKGRKRKIVRTVALTFSLLFGRLGVNNSALSSQSCAFSYVSERVIEDGRFNLDEITN